MTTRNNFWEIEDGQWFRVFLKHKMRCCDCGLTHDVDIKIDPSDPKSILMRMKRNNKATRQVRNKRRKNA